MRRFRTWHNKRISCHAESFEDFILCLEQAISELKQMHADGIQMQERNFMDEYIRLYTDCEHAAVKHRFHD